MVYVGNEKKEVEKPKLKKEQVKKSDTQSKQDSLEEVKTVPPTQKEKEAASPSLIRESPKEAEIPSKSEESLSLTKELPKKAPEEPEKEMTEELSKETSEESVKGPLERPAEEAPVLSLTQAPKKETEESETQEVITEQNAEAEIIKHKQQRDIITQEITEFKEQVENYRENSNRKNEINPNMMEDWEKYLAVTQEEKKHLVIAQGNAQIRKNKGLVKKLIEDNKEFEELKEKGNKDLKDFNNQIEQISSSNNRVEEVAVDVQYYFDELNHSIITFRRQKEDFENDGGVFPESSLLDKLDDSEKNIRKSYELLKHKLGKQGISKSKSRFMSKDIRQEKEMDLIRFEQEIINKIAEKKKERDNLKKSLDTLDKIKENNIKFDTIFKDTKEIQDTAIQLYSEFDTEEEKNVVGDSITESQTEETAEIYDVTKERKFKEAKEKKRELEKREMEILESLKEIVGNSESVGLISRNRKEKYNIYKSNRNKLEQKSRTAKGEKIQLKQNARLRSKDNMIRYYCDIRNHAQSRLFDFFEKYDKSQKKWRYEEQQQIDVEEEYQRFEDSKQGFIQTLTEFKQEEVKEQNIEEEATNFNNSEEEIIKKKSAYQENRKKIKKPYFMIQKFNAPKAPMIMRLVQRVKQVETKGPAARHSNYEGKSQALLRNMEKAEEFTPNKIMSVAGKVFGANEINAELTSDIIIDGSETVLDAAATGLDIKSDISDLKEEFDPKIWGKYKEIQGNKTKEGADIFQLGMNIYSLIKNSYNMFKEVILTIKEWSGGVDKREKLKRVLSLAENTVELFDSCIGFLDSKVPVLSTIKGGLEIILKIIDWIKSADSRRAIAKRKDELWKRIEEKNKKYQGTDDANLYDVNNEENVEQAKQTGFEKTIGASLSRIISPMPYRTSRTYAKEQSLKRNIRQRERFINTEENPNGIEENEFDEETARTSSVDDKAMEGISGRIHMLRRERLEREDITPEQRTALKSDLRALKALRDMNEFQIASEAEKRMKNKERQDIEDFIKTGISIVSDFIKLTASPAAIAALVLNIGTSIYDVAKGGIKRVIQYSRDNKKSFYSTKNKENRRNQMAETMYDRLAVLSQSLNDSGKIKIEEMDDWELKESAEHFQALEINLCTGLNAYISHIIECTSKDEMIENMGRAFSVEGN